MNQQGMIYVFTGDGKGKTSAALGVAVRAVCNGMKVAWVAWYKEAKWDISEKHIVDYLPLDFYLMGRGFYIKSTKYQAPSTKKHGQVQKSALLEGGGLVLDHAAKTEHKEAAKAALEKVRELLESGNYEVIICDEMNNALDDGLLKTEEVVSLLEGRGQTHLVLTGRNVSQEIIKYADLVTEMKKIKHPYDRGIKAVKGLDF